MSESQYFCPRLIDYLAIVGAHPNSLKRSSLFELQNNNGTKHREEPSGIGSVSTEENFYVQVTHFDFFINLFVFSKIIIGIVLCNPIISKMVYKASYITTIITLLIMY